MNWLKNLLAPKPKVVSICVPMFARGMTLQEFRAFENRVREVRELYKTPLMQDIFGVLREQTPRGYPLRGEKVSEIDAAIELGRKEGYQDCVDCLIALANYPPPPSQEVPQDWGASQRMKEEGFGFPEQASQEQMR